MGYESKLVVVKKWNFKDIKGIDSFGETIAELSLSGMPNEFFPIDETFENELDEGKYVCIGDYTDVTEDKYGKRLRYTSVEKLLRILYACEAKEHYRRTELAINTLKTFTSKDWNDIVVVHYGY